MVALDVIEEVCMFLTPESTDILCKKKRTDATSETL
jgi:hypothetical protein